MEYDISSIEKLFSKHLVPAWPTWRGACPSARRSPWPNV